MSVATPNEQESDLPILSQKKCIRTWHSGICSFQWPQLSKSYLPWWGAELASSAGKTLHSFKLRIKVIPWGRWSHLCWPFKSLQELLYTYVYLLLSLLLQYYSNYNSSHPKKKWNVPVDKFNDMYCYCAQSLVVCKVNFFCFPAWFCIFNRKDAAWHAAGVRAHQHVASYQGGDKFTRQNRDL